MRSSRARSPDRLGGERERGKVSVHHGAGLYAGAQPAGSGSVILAGPMIFGRGPVTSSGTCCGHTSARHTAKDLFDGGRDGQVVSLSGGGRRCAG